jgi:hypothetical protein
MFCLFKKIEVLLIILLCDDHSSLRVDLSLLQATEAGSSSLSHRNRLNLAGSPLLYLSTACTCLQPPLHLRHRISSQRCMPKVLTRSPMSPPEGSKPTMPHRRSNINRTCLQGDLCMLPLDLATVLQLLLSSGDLLPLTRPRMLLAIPLSRTQPLPP